MSFDLQDQLMTKSVKDSPVERLDMGGGGGDGGNDMPTKHPMDDDGIRATHRMLLGQYRHELEVQTDNRVEMATDEAYYDHEQWTEEEKRILEERGQAAITYNVIHNTVNWVIGTEKRGRTDFKIQPRGKEDAKPAEAKTKYMKYVSDCWHTPFNRSRSFGEQVKAGLGWIETSVPSEDDEEPTGDRFESWRNILHDSAATEMDGSDMRYQFRTKWLDLDIAIAMFPGSKAHLEQSASEITDFGAMTLLDGDEAMDGAEFSREQTGSGEDALNGFRRKRVRVIEAWYKNPEMTDKIRGGSFKGDIYDANDPRHAEAIAAGKGRLHKKLTMRVRVMLMTTLHPLLDMASPFRHNRLKFVPLWGYINSRTNLPYGLIRGLRPIQDDINKRASKALGILSNNKTIMEEGALGDNMTIDEYIEEASNPNAVITIKAGKRLDMDVDRELAPAHLSLMDRGMEMIRSVGGVTAENLGEGAKSASGRAIALRQDQGSTSTTTFFDNLRFGAQNHGEITLCNIEQFVTEEKQYRVTNERGVAAFEGVNDGSPENDITRSKADFVISEEDWRATIRQAANEQLFDLLAKMPPDVAVMIFDLVIDGMDITNREEIVKRIRQATGQRDPDATEPTPEEMAAQQAKQAQDELAQAQVRLQMAEVKAKIALTEAQTATANAQVKKIGADTVNANMTAAVAAMTAATQVITMPTIARVADGLLTQGGWKTGDAVPTNLAAQGMAVAPPMQQQQPLALPAPATPEQLQQPQIGV